MSTSTRTRQSTLPWSRERFRSITGVCSMPRAPTPTDRWRLGLAMQFITPSMQQVVAREDYAQLVRGEDRLRSLQKTCRVPKWNFDEAGIAIREQVMNRAIGGALCRFQAQTRRRRLPPEPVVGLDTMKAQIGPYRRRANGAQLEPLGSFSWRWPEKSGLSKCVLLRSYRRPGFRREQDSLEVWTALTYAATKTTSIELGPAGISDYVSPSDYAAASGGGG